jgi:biofilm PGA synthesis protein PgaA
VRHGAVARDALDPPQRHTLTDSAISESEWLAESAWAGAFDMTRTLHDRVVALRQRDAFAQATALFETLSGELPDYVLAAAADAYLAQRDPRTALALLDRAIADRRGRVTWDWRLARVNALSDAERHDDARAALEELEFDVRMVQAEASDPMRDEGASAWVDRLNIVKANLERFSHRFDDSVRRLEQAHADTPFDLDVRMAQAGIELDRLQPRRALASARRLQLDHPDSMWPHVAQVEALLDLGDHVGVRDALGRLREQFGESPTLERLERSVTIRRMGVARLSVGPARNQGSPASPNPIGELRVDATVDSPLWADTWRLLAGWQLRSAHLPEGSVYRRRVAAGARIERPELELSAVATGDPEGHDRGAQARAVITLADAWRATLRSARKADDVPLRAHRTGVSLDTDTAELAWHPSERRTLLAEIDTGRFSDGNQRRGGLVAWRERWSDSPARTFETRLSLGTVGFSKQDVAYFAPVRYDSMGLAFTLMQRLHREYDTNWLHRVTLEPTVNRQSGAPTVAGLNLSYEHEWEIRARWGGRAGLSFVRRPYDGVSETRWIGSLELFARY